MTEPTILDESAVSEIEARLHLTTDGDAVFVLSQVRDLIATVRHLRWQVDLCEKAFELDSALKLSEVGDLNALQVVRKMVDLQSQLEQLRAERETLIYWLLRAYQSGHREGWESGASTDETMDGLCSVLANRGYDPNLSDAANELLKTKPKF